MVDNPNENYFQPSLGSITGFDKITLPDGTVDLAKTGWSLDELRRFLLNENGANFASPDWVLLLNEMIQEHIQDHNNPHEVTLEQVTPDFVAGVLENLTSGTVPDVSPFLSFDVDCPLPLGNIYPATHTTSNSYRVIEGGLFVDTATELENVGVSSLTGDAGLPMFNYTSSIVPDNWYARPDFPINTTVIKRPGNDLSYPFDFYTVSEVAGTHSSGVALGAAVGAGSVYTLTFFVLPTAAAGSLVIYQSSDASNTMTVDLVTGGYELTSDQIVGDTTQYQSGVIRVSFRFTGRASGNNQVVILHRNSNDTSTVRDGQDGRILFHMGKPLISQAPQNHPIPVVGAAAFGNSALVFDPVRLRIPSTLNRLLLTLSIDLGDEPSGFRGAERTILDMGSLKIVRDAQNIYVKLGGITLFTSTILPGLNVVALSYSPVSVVFKDRAGDRQTLTAQFSPLALSAMTVGQFDGYLRSIALYATSDETKCVEFLANG